MALKLNVGVSRKVGLPAFGSVGASCNLELEVDAGLLERDLDAFHARVRDAYAAARQAVHDELARLHAGAQAGPLEHPRDDPRPGDRATRDRHETNGRRADAPRGSGDRGPRPGPPRRSRSRRWWPWLAAPAPTWRVCCATSTAWPGPRS
jgi:hypothetical protein